MHVKWMFWQRETFAETFLQMKNFRSHSFTGFIDFNGFLKTWLGLRHVAQPQKQFFIYCYSLLK